MGRDGAIQNRGMSSSEEVLYTIIRNPSLHFSEKPGLVRSFTKSEVLVSMGFPVLLGLGCPPASATVSGDDEPPRVRRCCSFAPGGSAIAAASRKRSHVLMQAGDSQVLSVAGMFTLISLLMVQRRDQAALEP